MRADEMPDDKDKKGVSAGLATSAVVAAIGAEPPFPLSGAGRDAGEPNTIPEDPHFHGAQLRMLQEMLDFAPIGYIVTDARGIIKEANHTAGDFMKASRAYLIDKPL